MSSLYLDKSCTVEQDVLLLTIMSLLLCSLHSRGLITVWYIRWRRFLKILICALLPDSLTLLLSWSVMFIFFSSSHFHRLFLGCLWNARHITLLVFYECHVNGSFHWEKLTPTFLHHYLLIVMAHSFIESPFMWRIFTWRPFKERTFRKRPFIRHPFIELYFKWRSFTKTSLYRTLIFLTSVYRMSIFRNFQ